MVTYAFLFLIIANVAAVLGFGGIPPRCLLSYA